MPRRIILPASRCPPGYPPAQVFDRRTLKSFNISFSSPPVRESLDNYIVDWAPTLSRARTYS